MPEPSTWVHVSDRTECSDLEGITGPEFGPFQCYAHEEEVVCVETTEQWVARYVRERMDDEKFMALVRKNARPTRSADVRTALHALADALEGKEPVGDDWGMGFALPGGEALRGYRRRNHRR